MHKFFPLPRRSYSPIPILLYLSHCFSLHLPLLWGIQHGCPRFLFYSSSAEGELILFWVLKAVLHLSYIDPSVTFFWYKIAIATIKFVEAHERYCFSDSTITYYFRQFCPQTSCKSLGVVGAGNEDAINALIHLVRTTPDEPTRWIGIQGLGKIGTGNREVIETLIEQLSIPGKAVEGILRQI